VRLHETVRLDTTARVHPRGATLIVTGFVTFFQSLAIRENIKNGAGCRAAQ
jgi:hypothetical protein